MVLIYYTSGIEVSHPYFEGRAQWGIDLVVSRTARPYTDENGHGTHVTGKQARSITLLVYLESKNMLYLLSLYEPSSN